MLDPLQECVRPGKFGREQCKRDEDHQDPWAGQDQHRDADDEQHHADHEDQHPAQTWVDASEPPIESLFHLLTSMRNFRIEVLPWTTVHAGPGAFGAVLTGLSLEATPLYVCTQL
jgi:hypothetical protein